MNLFGIDGKIYKFLDKFWGMVWISVLWIVCSIPIFTIGASSTAAYYAMVRSVRHNEDNVTRDFFKAFKRNFRQATIMTLVYIFVGAAFSFATWFYYSHQGGFNLGLRWFFYFLILIFLCTITYAFSWLSRYEMTTFHAITYPIAITLMHPGFSVGLIIFWAGVIIGLYWSFNTFLFAPLLVIAPGVKCLLDTYLIEHILKKYEAIALACAAEENAKASAEENEKAAATEENEKSAAAEENEKTTTSEESETSAATEENTK